LTLGSSGLALDFDHGKFGYRHESIGQWSSAFKRLSELLAGTVTWHEFGDEKSRNALLGKGQFYWTNPESNAYVPVDNFVFVTDAGHEATLAGVGGRTVISVQLADGLNTHEWLDNHGDGLNRLADLLENTLVTNAPTNEGALSAAPVEGHFVVKCIFKRDDVLLAPILTFLTKEGHFVALETATREWTLRAFDGVSRTKVQVFKATTKYTALRVLADLLSGAVTWHAFTGKEV
jgi:hypothetical protein